MPEVIHRSLKLRKSRKADIIIIIYHLAIDRQEMLVLNGVEKCQKICKIPTSTRPAHSVS